MSRSQFLLYQQPMCMQTRIFSETISLWYVLRLNHYDQSYCKVYPIQRTLFIRYSILVHFILQYRRFHWTQLVRLVTCVPITMQGVEGWRVSATTTTSRNMASVVSDYINSNISKDYCGLKILFISQGVCFFRHLYTSLNISSLQ